MSSQQLHAESRGRKCPSVSLRTCIREVKVRIEFKRCNHLLSRWRITRESRNSPFAGRLHGGRRAASFFKIRAVLGQALVFPDRNCCSASPPPWISCSFLLQTLYINQKPVTSQFVRPRSDDLLAGRAAIENALYNSTFARAFRSQRWKKTEKKKKKQRGAKKP